MATMKKKPMKSSNPFPMKGSAKKGSSSKSSSKTCPTCGQKC